MTGKRITAFAGHYGSGKTHLALNYAVWRKQTDKLVCIADLDIVNPYYRTQDALSVLKQTGVELVASPFAGSNAELPSMPPDAARVFDDTTITAVLDIGGDDRGALALGRYAPRMKDPTETDMLLVLNASRPLTKSPEDALEIMREIEAASHVSFTGVVNNTNLGSDTTADIILRSHEYALEVCSLAGLPLVFTSAREDLIPALTGIGELFPIRLFAKDEWKI